MEGAIPSFGIPNPTALLPGELEKGFMEKNEGSWWKWRGFWIQFGASQQRKTMGILEAVKGHQAGWSRGCWRDLELF